MNYTMHYCWIIVHCIVTIERYIALLLNYILRYYATIHCVIELYIAVLLSTLMHQRSEKHAWKAWHHHQSTGHQYKQLIYPQLPHIPIYYEHVWQQRTIHSVQTVTTPPTVILNMVRPFVELPLSSRAPASDKPLPKSTKLPSNLLDDKSNTLRLCSVPRPFGTLPVIELFRTLNT